jgi:hypothetical protein
LSCLHGVRGRGTTNGRLLLPKAFEAVVKILPDDSTSNGEVPKTKFADQFAQLKRLCEEEAATPSVGDSSSTTATIGAVASNLGIQWCL